MEIRTLAAPLSHELDKVKGSRFLALAAPVADEEAVRAVLAGVRAAHKGASHHPHAWRLGPGGARWRAADDGEPAGSSGRPILRELEARGLVDALVVVTRWFGGTKLGVGGLVRAYGAAAAAVLERADVCVRRLTRRLEVRHPYDGSGAVAAVLAAYGLAAREAAYGADVRLVVDVPVEEVDAFLDLLAERTAARASAREVEAGP